MSQKRLSTRQQVVNMKAHVCRDCGHKGKKQITAILKYEDKVYYWEENNNDN